MTAEGLIAGDPYAELSEPSKSLTPLMENIVTQVLVSVFIRHYTEINNITDMLYLKASYL